MTGDYPPGTRKRVSSTRKDGGTTECVIRDSTSFVLESLLLHPESFTHEMSLS